MLNNFQQVISCAEAVFALAFNLRGDLLAIGQAAGFLTVLHFPSLAQVTSCSIFSVLRSFVGLFSSIVFSQRAHL